jgi:hypothetical protein
VIVVRVTWHRGRWHVGLDSYGYEDGNGYRLKRDAMTAGRAIARYVDGELVPHDIFGRDQKRGRASFGNDPPSRPG